MSVRSQVRAVDRPVVSVPRHIGGVAVEGVVGDQTGGEAARGDALEGDPKAVVHALVVGLRGPSKGCPGYGLVAVPTSALGYFPRSRCRSRWIGYRSGQVGSVPIVRPFPDVPVHVVKAPGVGGVLPDLARLTDSACLVIGFGGVDRGAP